MGGAERFFIRLTNGLASLDHPTQAIVRAGYEVGPNIPLNVKKYEISMRSTWDPFAKHNIKRIIKKESPQIVQTYMTRATLLTRINKNSGVTHVARLGGYYKLKNFAHAHAWIGNTKGICDYLIKGGFPAEKIFHISNFIDIPKPVSEKKLSLLKKSLGIPEDGFCFLTAGRFVEVKGHSELLSGFAKLPATINNRTLYLIMLGNGPLEQKLKELARQLNIESRIIWPGWQTNPEPFFQLADLIVFTSRERETLGNVILEAWAAKKPVLTTKFRGALEITEHGLNAWQAECESPSSIAEGMEQLIKDKKLMEQIAENGHKKVLTHFSKEKIINRYLEVYEKLTKF